MNSTSKPLVVIITGLSGAGHSTALNTLADNGLYCIDNLPVELLDGTLDLIDSGRLNAKSGYALCMDIRHHGFVKDFKKIKKKISDRADLSVLFLTAEPNVIATRYSATRRKHPLLGAGETLMEAIDRERELINPIEELADTVIDTSEWSPHVLARAIEDRFSKNLAPRTLHLTITSFGFKYGQQRPVDSMFDVRFIHNPFFVKELKEKTGLDQVVRSYVFEDPNAQVMFNKIEDMARFLLPQYHREGKHYFRIGIGCSGGRHRSVSFAERLGQRLLEEPIDNILTTIIHRDIDRA